MNQVKLNHLLPQNKKDSGKKPKGFSESGFNYNHFIRRLFKEEPLPKELDSLRQDQINDLVTRQAIPVTIKDIVQNGPLSDWYILAASDIFEWPVKIPVGEFLPSFNENRQSLDQTDYLNIIHSYSNLLKLYIGYECRIIPLCLENNVLYASRLEYLNIQQRTSFFNLDPSLNIKRNDLLQAKIINKLGNLIILESCGREIKLKPKQFNPVVYSHLEQNQTTLLRLKHVWTDKLNQKVINFRTVPALSDTDKWLIKTQPLKVGDIISGRIIRILKNGCLVKTNDFKVFATFGTRQRIKLGKKVNLKIRNINYNSFKIFGSLV